MLEDIKLTRCAVHDCPACPVCRFLAETGSPARVVLERSDPYGKGVVVLGYDDAGGLYIEVRHACGSQRATFSSNPKILRRFLRDAHKAEPE